MDAPAGWFYKLLHGRRPFARRRQMFVITTNLPSCPAAGKRNSSRKSRSPVESRRHISACCAPPMRSRRGLAQTVRFYRHAIQRTAHLARRRGRGLALPRDRHAHDYRRSRHYASAPSLHRLEDRRLVQRTRAPHDRRVIYGKITAAGLKLLREIDTPMERHGREMLGHVGQEKLKQLPELLELVRGGKPGDRRDAG
jgi:hypothetical protein